MRDRRSVAFSRGRGRDRASADQRDVGVDHEPGEVGRQASWASSRAARGLRGVADEGVDLGRAQVALVESHVLLPVEPDVLEANRRKSRTV